MATRIGIITAGGDSPGLNAAIRGVGKAAVACGMEVIGFRDGFRGLAEDSRLRLDRRALAGILTTGGTVLGTGRDKPHRMEVDGQHARHDAASSPGITRGTSSTRWCASAAVAPTRMRCG